MKKSTIFGNFTENKLLWIFGTLKNDLPLWQESKVRTQNQN